MSERNLQVVPQNVIVFPGQRTKNTVNTHPMHRDDTLRVPNRLQRRVNRLNSENPLVATTLLLSMFDRPDELPDSQIRPWPHTKSDLQVRLEEIPTLDDLRTSHDALVERGIECSFANFCCSVLAYNVLQAEHARTAVKAPHLWLVPVQ